MQMSCICVNIAVVSFSGNITDRYSLFCAIFTGSTAQSVFVELNVSYTHGHLISKLFKTCSDICVVFNKDTSKVVFLGFITLAATLSLFVLFLWQHECTSNFANLRRLLALWDESEINTRMFLIALCEQFKTFLYFFM